MRPLVYGWLLTALSTVAFAAEPGKTSTADLSALRYYSSRHETARVEAEIRRLRVLFPNFEVPADLGLAGGPDETALWTLFASDKLDELDRAISERRNREAGYQPTADLLAKIAWKRARAQFMLLTDAGSHAEALALLEATPALDSKTDVEVRWRKAALLAALARPADAVAVYDAILSETIDPAIRLATAQKALATLPTAFIPPLLAKAGAGVTDPAAFAALDLTLLVRRGTESLATDVTVEPLSTEEIAKLEAAATKSGDAGEAALLGWLHWNSGKAAQALPWFEQALAKKPDASNAHGAALALAATGEEEAAENLAYEWRDRDPALRSFFLGVLAPALTEDRPRPISPERLARYAVVTEAAADGDAAQALGWYAFNTRRVRAAKAWFESALAWSPRDTTALGYALSLQRLGESAALRRFIDANRLDYPILLDLMVRDRDPSRRPMLELQRLPVPRQTMAGGGTMQAAYARKDFTTCLRLAREREARAALSADDMRLKGWCLLAAARPTEAATSFAKAGGEDGAYGEALALIRKGDGAGAVNAARLIRDADRRSEIGVAALANAAVVSFRKERYRDTLAALDRRKALVPEPRDLATLRAFALTKLGEREEARRLFDRLDRQMSTRDTRSGLSETDPSRLMGR